MLLYDPHFQSWSIPMMKSINADASRITLFVSFPHNIVFISLPQHLQIDSSLSHLGAGLRLIPLHFFRLLSCTSS